MVMNMRQNETIKTNLYVLLAVLIVLAAGLTAALAFDGSAADDRRTQLEQYAADTDGKDIGDAGISAASDAQEQTPQEKADTATRAVDAGVRPEPAAADTTTYALRTKDGYLQVYILETGDFYMETSIVYRLLPEQVQAQIDAGKYFETEEELFGFLENYSS